MKASRNSELAHACRRALGTRQGPEDLRRRRRVPEKPPLSKITDRRLVTIEGLKATCCLLSWVYPLRDRKGWKP